MILVFISALAQLGAADITLVILVFISAFAQLSVAFITLVVCISVGAIADNFGASAMVTLVVAVVVCIGVNQCSNFFGVSRAAAFGSTSVGFHARNFAGRSLRLFTLVPGVGHGPTVFITAVDTHEGVGRILAIAVALDCTSIGVFQLGNVLHIPGLGFRPIGNEVGGVGGSTLFQTSCGSLHSIGGGDDFGFVMCCIVAAGAGSGAGLAVVAPAVADSPVMLQSLDFLMAADPGLAVLAVSTSGVADLGTGCCGLTMLSLIHMVGAVDAQIFSGTLIRGVSRTVIYSRCGVGSHTLDCTGSGGGDLGSHFNIHTLLCVAMTDHLCGADITVPAKDRSTVGMSACSSFIVGIAVAAALNLASVGGEAAVLAGGRCHNAIVVAMIALFALNRLCVTVVDTLIFAGGGVGSGVVCLAVTGSLVAYNAVQAFGGLGLSANGAGDGDGISGAVLGEVHLGVCVAVTISLTIVEGLAALCAAGAAIVVKSRIGAGSIGLFESIFRILPIIGMVDHSHILSGGGLFSCPIHAESRSVGGSTHYSTGRGSCDLTCDSCSHFLHVARIVGTGALCCAALAVISPSVGSLTIIVRLCRNCFTRLHLRSAFTHDIASVACFRTGSILGIHGVIHAGVIGAVLFTGNGFSLGNSTADGAICFINRFGHAGTGGLEVALHREGAFAHHIFTGITLVVAVIIRMGSHFSFLTADGALVPMVVGIRCPFLAVGAAHSSGLAVFVAVTANGTGVGGEAAACAGGSGDYGIIAVGDLTGGAAAVVTFGIAGVVPGVGILILFQHHSSCLGFKICPLGVFCEGGGVDDAALCGAGGRRFHIGGSIGIHGQGVRLVVGTGTGGSDLGVVLCPGVAAFGNGILVAQGGDLAVAGLPGIEVFDHGSAGFVCVIKSAGGALPVGLMTLRNAGGFRSSRRSQSMSRSAGICAPDIQTIGIGTALNDTGQ